MYFTQTIAVAILAYTAAAAPAGPTCASRDDVCRKYTANNNLSSAECDISLAQCINACQVPFAACQTAPNANHSACASSLVICTGISYEDSIKPQSAVAKRDDAPTSANGTPVYQGDCEQLDTICRTLPNANMTQCSADTAQCKDTCSKKADACFTAPDANHAVCAGEYASCLGENPYN